MTTLDEIRTEMMARIEKMEWQAGKVDSLIRQGRLDESKRQYAHQIIIFDFSLKEAQALARIGDVQKAGRSLAEAKVCLDSIALISYISEKKTIYDNAKRRYDLALEKTESLLEMCQAGGCS